MNLVVVGCKDDVEGGCEQAGSMEGVLEGIGCDEANEVSIANLLIATTLIN